MSQKNLMYLVKDLDQIFLFLLTNFSLYFETERVCTFNSKSIINFGLLVTQKYLKTIFFFIEKTIFNPFTVTPKNFKCLVNISHRHNC
jgi:hypothetical protein